MHSLIASGLLVLSCLSFAGCAADTSDGASEGEEEDALTGRCGSALGDRIHEAATRGPSTVKGALESRRNRVVKGPIVGGEAIANEIGDLIANAKEEILIQTFDIEQESWMAGQLRDALRTRKKPGVKVFILVNPAQGQRGPLPESPSAGVKRMHDFFADTGATVGVWNHAQWFNLLEVLHSKTLVVDGRRAMVTDTNIQKNADPVEHGGNGWFQTAMVVEGEIATKLREDIVDAWGDATPKTHLERTLPTVPATGACSRMIVLSREAGASEGSSADLGYMALFRGASKSVNIITPNLNDDHALQAIADATAKTQVHIVLSKGFNDSTEKLGQGGTNEHNVTRLVSMAKNKCNLHVRWFAKANGTVTVGNGKAANHAKWATADGTTMIIGSQNLDTEAWKREREVNIVVDEKSAVGRFDALFEKVWQRSPVAFDKDGC